MIAASSSEPIFIDRDPRLFQEMLELLRSGLEYEPPHDQRLIKQVARELRYFQIPVPLSMASTGAAASPSLSRVYVAGGSSDLGIHRATSQVSCYDVSFDGWTSITNLPLPKTSLSLAILGCQLFALGGKDCLGNESSEALTLDLRDPHASWSSSSERETATRPMSIPRHSFSSATAFSRIYVLGNGRASHNQVGDSVEFFDPGSLSWWSAPPLPYLPCHHAAASWPGPCGEPGSSSGVIGDHSSCIIVSGGQGLEEEEFLLSSPLVAEALLMLDVRSKSGWARLGCCDDGNLKRGHRARHGIAALDGRVYLMGGVQDGEVEATSLVECFDMRAGRWVDDGAPKLPVPLVSLGATAVGGQLMIMGGSSPDEKVHGAVYQWSPKDEGRLTSSSVSWIEARSMRAPLHSFSAVSYHS